MRSHSEQVRTASQSHARHSATRRRKRLLLEQDVLLHSDIVHQHAALLGRGTQDVLLVRERHHHVDDGIDLVVGVR